ncbi:transposase [Streptomyces sp. SAI-117]|nr:transposase [Streptomyces sp. SAI-117]
MLSPGIRSLRGPHELVTSKNSTLEGKDLIYCGIDWAERTHDVALVDDSGQLLAKRHITDDAADYKILLDLLAEYGDTEEDPIPVAIETSRGLVVAVLRTGKRQVFAINPMAAARYRDRHSVSRKKSDPGDALVLANILRTDLHAPRPLPQDSDLARAVAVLARAQQDVTRRLSFHACKPCPSSEGSSSDSANWRNWDDW